MGSWNRRPWPLITLRPLHRNVIYAIENHFSLAKWPSLTFSGFLCHWLLVANHTLQRLSVTGYLTTPQYYCMHSISCVLFWLWSIDHAQSQHSPCIGRKHFLLRTCQPHFFKWPHGLYLISWEEKFPVYVVNDDSMTLIITQL